MSASPHPRIAAPAPGLPSLVATANEPFPLWIESKLPEEDVRAWVTTLAARDRYDGSRIPLLVDAPQPVPDGESPASVSALRAAANGERLWRATAALSRAPQGSTSTRFRLLDLVSGDRCVRRRCLALSKAGSTRLRVAFASDLHVAQIWDPIDAALRRHAPDLADHYLHPGALFRAFVAEANSLAHRGELDLVVLGGDIVDHVHSGIGADGHHTNVDQFVAMLADLDVPSFAIPGNHDYRWHPWRPRIYPYESVGLPRSRVAAALRREGLWDWSAWRLSDLRALKSRDERGASALLPHLRELAPAVDYTVRLDEITLTFLSTGRDVLPRWHRVEPGRRRLLLRALPHSWEHPDSEGLTPQQIERMERSLAAPTGQAVFFHAPLFNPPPGARVERHLARLDPSESGSAAGRARLERQLARTGLRHGVFFRNPGSVAAALLSSQRPTAVFSGHVHHAHAIRYDRSSAALQSLPLPFHDADDAAVHLFNAPALGQTAMTHGEPPGFLLARFDTGRLASVEVRSLGATGATPRQRAESRT